MTEHLHKNRRIYANGVFVSCGVYSDEVWQSASTEAAPRLRHCETVTDVTVVAIRAFSVES